MLGRLLLFAARALRPLGVTLVLSRSVILTPRADGWNDAQPGRMTIRLARIA